ncbi:MAG: flagellar hook-basal body complex protein, partial [Clostridium sp.]|nr:flagellar hook-basal body complex protein [Clostridium sp.]
NGTEYYTRDGNFNLDSYGRLVSNNGNILEVQYTNGYSENNTGLTSGNFNINNKGEIYIDENGNYTKVGEIAVYNAVGNNAFTSVGDNMYKELDEVQVYRTLDADIYQGCLERSNVDLTQEMTDMIVTQRAFQLSSKGISTADEMWQMINNLR